MGDLYNPLPKYEFLPELLRGLIGTQYVEYLT